MGDPVRDPTALRKDTLTYTGIKKPFDLSNITPIPDHIGYEGATLNTAIKNSPVYGKQPDARGGYGYNQIDQSPENRETERRARVLDTMNNMYFLSDGAKSNHGAGQSNIAPVGLDAGFIKAPQKENEDTRQQEKNREQETKRREWNSGLPAEQARFTNAAAEAHQVATAYNNIHAQYAAIDITKTLRQLGLSESMAQQIMSNWNTLQAAVERFNTSIDYKNLLRNNQAEITRVSAMTHFLAGLENFATRAVAASLAGAVTPDVLTSALANMMEYIVSLINKLLG